MIGIKIFDNVLQGFMANSWSSEGNFHCTLPLRNPKSPQKSALSITTLLLYETASLICSNIAWCIWCPFRVPGKRLDVDTIKQTWKHRNYFDFFLGAILPCLSATITFWRVSGGRGSITVIISQKLIEKLILSQKKGDLSGKNDTKKIKQTRKKKEHWVCAKMNRKL